MPTSKWKEENPKLLCYCPRPLYEQVEALQRDRGLRSISAAAVAIISEYFARQEALSAPGFDSPEGRRLLKAIADYAAIPAAPRTMVEEIAPHARSKDYSPEALALRAEEGWLTRKEAYKVLWGLGWRKKIHALSFLLKTEVPPELAEFGVVIDLDHRTNSPRGINPRWIKVGGA